MWWQVRLIGGSANTSCFWGAGAFITHGDGNRRWMCCTVMVGHPALVGATRVWSHSNEVSAWVVLGHWLTFVHPLTAICIVGLNYKGNKLSKRKALWTCWLPFQNVWPEWDCMRQQKELHCHILYLQMRQRMTILAMCHCKQCWQQYVCTHRHAIT